MVSAHGSRHNGADEGSPAAVLKEPGPCGNQMGRWTVDEHEKFLAGK